MKHLTSLIICISLTIGMLTAQDGNIGIGTTEPDASAILELSSENKGLLITRVALTGSDDRTTIPNPQKGLLVYNTSSALPEGFYYWDGTQWTHLRTNACVKLDEAYNCPNAGEGRKIVANKGEVDITMPEGAENNTALVVTSQKPSNGDVTSAADFIQTSSGTAVWAGATLNDNPYPVITAYTNSKTGGAIEAISTDTENMNAVIMASDTCNAVGETTNDSTVIGGAAIAGFYKGTGNGVAVWGEAEAKNGYAPAGVYGQNKSINYDTYGVVGDGYTGVKGQTSEANGNGVEGINDGTISDVGNAVGVYGAAASGNGVWGISDTAAGSGVVGTNNSIEGGEGVYGEGITGVYGLSVNHFGVIGESGKGVGVAGYTDTTFPAVQGKNYNENGVGITGVGGNSLTPVPGTTDEYYIGTGVQGAGLIGINGIGGDVIKIPGTSTEYYAGTGVQGEGFIGVSGFGSDSAIENIMDGIGVYGEGYWGVFSNGNMYAAGGLICTGAISSTPPKNFLIPHPTKPDKLLKHTCIESPMPVNMYSGNAVCDGRGEAVVELPDYFGDININFRYQLTPVGGYAVLFVKEEIKGNRFVVAGGEPGMKVSWTVYADRNDEYVRTHPESRMDIIDRKTSELGVRYTSLERMKDRGRMGSLQLLDSSQKGSKRSAKLQLLDPPKKGSQRATKLGKVVPAAGKGESVKLGKYRSRTFKVAPTAASKRPAK